MARECRRCGSEWIDSVEVCGDCGADLLAPAGGEDATAPIDLVPIWRTASPDLLAEVVDRLEKAEVPYVVLAGTALAAFDDGGEAREPEPWRARLMVSSELEERAERIVRGLGGLG